MNNPKIPTKEECLAILNKNKTPSNVIEHCKTVCKVAEEIAGRIIAKGIKVNKELVVAAALLHDIERHKEDHVTVGAKLIKSMGFQEISEIIKKHTLHDLEKLGSQLKTIEEKIVFYADKRAAGAKIVSLKERMEDLKRRYKKDFNKQLEFTRKIEEELMQ